MYTLRRIEKDGTETNTYLGTEYEIIDFRNESKFNDCIATTFFNVPDYAKVFCFVVCREINQMFPVYEEEKSYIMTESGKTFDRLRT